MTDSPQLHVIGGPNGSGKTTLAVEYARIKQVPYLAADAIAAELNPLNPSSVDVEAGRQFIQQLREHISRSESCVVESTLSGRSFRQAISAAKLAGFDVGVAFVFVDSADVCVARVAERVSKGGHHVPEADVRRRFTRSVRKFLDTISTIGRSLVVVI